MTVKTRFAPSPTGYLHIGGARTALFSWLYARKHNGQFILRIEDTDLERSTQEAVDAILEGMEWLGLDYDEGPYFQTKRMDRYREVLDQLLDQGLAYKCYCSRERLEKLREQQEAKKEKPRYDMLCRDKHPSHDDDIHVIRFKNPTEGEVSFDDQVRGKVTFKNYELDDLIIARSDGVPTYNFCVVVDDWDMGITHVIRGDDHINNTPRQINILKALNAPIPTYAHLPMILGPDGKRLSKRHGAVSVLQYREDGYLPEATLNYLVRLGWSHGDQEIFTLEEMINYFDMNSINNSPAAINPDKLDWLNQHYLKTSDPKKTTPYLKAQLEKLGVDTNNGPDLSEIIKIQAERTKTLVEMAERSRFFFEDVKSYDEKAVSKNLKPEARPIIEHLIQEFSTLTNWTADPIHDVVIKTGEKFNVKLGNIAQPIRVAVTGTTVSPPINETLYLLGKEKTLARLQKSIDLIT